MTPRALLASALGVLVCYVLVDTLARAVSLWARWRPRRHDMRARWDARRGRR